jgi:hypothetical protein
MEPYFTLERLSRYLLAVARTSYAGLPVNFYKIEPTLLAWSRTNVS